MGPDPDANLDSAADHIREAARRGANIVCLPELFRAQYFCQREDLALFDLAEPIPGPSDRAAERELPASSGWSIVASLFERRAAGSLSQHGGDAGRGRLASPASIARCTFPTIRSTTRSFTSRRAIWDFEAVDTSLRAASARWSAGISGIRRARASPRCRAPKFCFIPRRLAGIRRRKKSSARRSTRPGRPSSAPMPSPTASMWRAVNRVGHENGDIRGNRAEGPGLEFWGGIVSGRSLWAHHCEGRRTTARKS